MKAYIFQSDVYCAACGEALRARITAEGNAPAHPDDERSFDSCDFPKGPYPDGGGEADCPQHCAACGLFLENPLTVEGECYVRRAAIEGGTGAQVALNEWVPYYGLAEDCTDCGQRKWRGFACECRSRLP